MPTHDTYLDNGTDIGLTVGEFILSHFDKFINNMTLKSVYLIATRDLSNLWLQFFLSQNQGFMRLFEKTVLK